VRDILFWVTQPPSPDQRYVLELPNWEAYLDKVALASLLIILCAVGALVGLYAYSAWRRRIHSPADLFQPYNCMWWLLLSIPAGVIAGIVAANTDLHMTLISDPTQGRSFTPVELVPTAIQIGSGTVLLCFVISALLIFVPGITPPAFKYRPQEWLFPWTRPKRS